MRQAVLFNVGPLGSSIARHVDSASRPAAKLGPGVQFQLPHSGKEHPRIVRIHGKARASDVFSGKKHTLPMLAAVHCTEDPAFLLRASRAPQRTGKNNLGIRGMNDNPAYAAGLLQPHVGPCLSGIGGFIDSIADHIAVADDPGLAGSRPHYTWVRWCHCKCADCRGGLLVEDRRPTVASVARFPYAAGGRSRVVRARVARHSGDRSNAVSDTRANKAESE